MKKKMFVLAFGLLLAFGSQGQYFEELPPGDGGGCGCGCPQQGCINRPSENNGRCKESSSNGNIIYTCVDLAWYQWSADCVK